MTQSDIQPAGDIPAFPCQSFPTEARHARLLGVYPQRQSGHFMQRVRIHAGLLRAEQWRAMAAMARRFSPDTPLHLTTRQDMELHDLSADDVPAVQQAMAAAGLTSLGSGGDTLRNITVCTCAAGGSSGAPDMLNLAHATGRTLAEYGHLFGLPRKFKIAFSGCAENCGRPFFHDLGFGAIRRDGVWGVKVIGAGSLGAKPELGIVLYDWIPVSDAPALSLAAMRLFDRLGDRQNRAKARLRHARQRLGDEAFRVELDNEFVATKSERPWPAIALAEPVTRSNARRALSFLKGDVTANQADVLAHLADDAALSVRIGNDHRVWLFSQDQNRLDRIIQEQPELAAAAAPQPIIIACPGTRWCGRALADTNRLAERLRDIFSGKADAQLIGISGCPNGCALSAVSDFGLIGGRSGQDEKYILLSSGGQGRDGRLARTVGTGLSADQVCQKLLS